TVIIIPSTQQAPTIVQGPYAGNVGLLDTGVDATGRLAVQIHQQTVTIADIEDVAVVGSVAERHAAFVDTLPLLVPLDVREQLPAVTEAVGRLGDDRRAVGMQGLQQDPLLQRAVQRDDAILEVEDLADAEPGALTALAVKEAGADRDTHLIGITHAIVAAEAVVTEQLCEAEVELGAVKGRQHALVLLLAVQIEQAGFQGLGVTIAGGALEDQPAVQAEYPNATVGIVDGAQRLVFKLPLGVPVLGGGDEEACSAADGEAYLGLHMHPGTGDQRPVLSVCLAEQCLVQAAVEAHVVGADAHLQPAEGIAVTQCQLGEAIIRTIDVSGRDKGIDDLDALRAHSAKPVLGAEVQLSVALQVGAAGDVEAAAAKVAK